MDLIRLHIRGISYSQTQTGAYALILEEDFGKRKIPVIIGSFEAQSIALALEKDITPPRPITHDLFTTFAKSFHIIVKAVFIYKLKDGVFYSNILFQNRDTDEEIEIDSRTSDAIALAVRFEAPVYATKEILEKAGVYTEMNEDELATESTFEKALDTIENQLNINDIEDSFAHLTDSEINDLISKAIENEDYETAAKLRDELVKRK
ncbi:bifunctional nuclease family protein [Apibacter sp. ESL0404]|uniref:bifunctional nuclease family protein n=1 Tax=Apibacter sp. ESL0404 TaxID=2704651 RepID=UPI001C69648A|nr:bifunctional nuclease domain-containing protein [Apibacter sp. ESL0404]QYN50635.1 bifunctional nuclease family protein [Apibacter sp. ESL0404]